MGAVVLEATGLTKRYPLAPSRADAGVGWSASFRGRPRRYFDALREVSFAVEAGDTLGLIGRNGAGKSTLVGVLAGTIRPTSGDVRLARRVASLLDLGTGFHPLETGRQNAESMLALYLRISRAAAAAQLGEVREFSGLGDRFEDPIRTYSDGMRLRLAFATVSVLRPEILITDEVLVVGDQEFQRRCEGWFDGFLGRGGTLILCSHDLGQISRLCRRTLWLDHGAIGKLGDTASVVRAYRDSFGTDENGQIPEAGVEHSSGKASGLPFEVTRLGLCDRAGESRQEFEPGADVYVTIELAAPAGIPNVFVGITTEELVPVYGVASDMDQAAPVALGDGLSRFQLRFTELLLVPGAYRLRAHALDETGTRLYDTVQLGFTILGEAASGAQGLVGLPHRFVPQEIA